MEKIKYHDIPNMFELLCKDSTQEKLNTIKSMQQFISKLSCIQLVKMDNVFRERSSMEWACDWRYKDPSQLINPLMSEEEKILVLGLSSFHPNGYFRENAIKELLNMGTECAITYILIRLNDWVSEIRYTSKQALIRFLTPQYAINFVKNLPLVLRLNQCSRDNHTEIINKIISIISSKEGAENLIEGLKEPDAKVRLACYKIILQRNILSHREIIDKVMRDTDPYNKLFVLRNMRNDLNVDEFQNTQHLLLQDKSSQIRIIALELFYKFEPEKSINVLEHYMFDKNHSVREESRFLLSKNKKYDFAAMYREELQNDGQIYGSIYGLGETGNKEDTKLIVGFMNCSDRKIVKATLISLGKLDLQGNREKIISMLNDERSSISKTAKCVLSENLYSSDGTAIYNIFKNAMYDHIKVNTSILLCSLNKWTSIRYIVELYFSDTKKVANFAQTSLEKWKLKYNRSFTNPNEKQLEDLKDTMFKFRHLIKESDRDFIEFCIRDF